MTDIPMCKPVAEPKLLQLDSQRNLLEIELNESLKRRREELQSNIESLGEADIGTTFDPENFKARTRELKTLNVTISSLQDSAVGTLMVLGSIAYMLTLSLQSSKNDKKNYQPSYKISGQN